MRLRRWRVVASVRVFPVRGVVVPCLRRRCFFSFLLHLRCPSRFGFFSGVPFTSGASFRLRCGAERVVVLRGACRCAGWARRSGFGKCSPQVGIIAKLGLGRSRSRRERCSSRLRGSLRVQGELFPWRGGVPLRWVRACPPWVFRGSGPAQPGARLPSACRTVVGGSLHRRWGLHCCRRHTT